MISGKLEFFKNKFQITHPSSIEYISDIQLLREKEPVYSLTAGLNMKSFIKLSNQVLQSLPDLDEWIDKMLITKYKFTSWIYIYLSIHKKKILCNFKEVFLRKQ